MMFEHIRKEAEKRKIMESEIASDIQNGMSICDVASKYHVTSNYVKAVIKCKQKEGKYE